MAIASHAAFDSSDSPRPAAGPVRAVRTSTLRRRGLLVLSYHRSLRGPDGNPPAVLDAHFAYIAAHFESVLPGERMRGSRMSICLCFDGAYYDFYTTIHPLLRKHGLSAVLGVTPGLIRDRADASVEERCTLTSAEARRHPARGGFCTWRELEEIARDESRAIAAHGYTPRSLTEPDADFEAEVHVPRTLLGSRLRTGVESFIFPYGRHNAEALDEAKSGYPYVFTSGNAMNSHWHHRVLYRVNADNLRSPTAPFEPGAMLRWRLRGLWNRLRRA